MAKLGEGLKFKYEPIWPQAETDMKFHYYEFLDDGTKVLRMHTEKFVLISSIEEFKSYIETYRGKIVAFDTETTGLTYGEDKIVGFSMSIDRWSGIYVPIRHNEMQEVTTEVPKLDKNGNKVITKAGKVSVKKETVVTFKESEENLDPKQALDILYEILVNAKLVLIHNAEFDLNVLKFEGYDVNKIKFLDTLILPYIFDPEATGLAGLKALEKRVLGRTVPEFKEVLGKKYKNFSMVPPKDGYVYACFDKETEVLTENGWVFWENYNGTDKLATIRLSDSLLEYQVPTKLYKYVYKGLMECCVTKHVDYCVTPNHNMVVAKSQKPAKGWVYKRADSLNVEEVALTAPKKLSSTEKYVYINGNKYEAEIMSELAALVLADGYVRIRNNTKSYEIHVVTSFEKNYDEIVSILERSPFKWKSYSSSSSKKVTNWSCWDRDLWTWLAPYAGSGSANKSVPREIFNLPKNCIEKFLRAYSITDGHNYKTGYTQFYSISTQMVDDLQRLLLMTGKRSSVHVRQPIDRIIENRVIKKETCHDMYTINVNSHSTTRYNKRSRFQTDYNDYVYCAEVPNHTLITRRHGKTLVTGNCNDTAGLYGIYEEMYPAVRKLLKQFKKPMVINGVPYDVLMKDNQMVKIFVDYYGHAKILIDREKAIKYKAQLEEKQRKVVEEIYRYFDKGMFNLSTSSKEFKVVMASKNVFTGVKTDKKADSYSSKAQAEMKKNLVKLKECTDNWRSFNFKDGKLSKNENGFILANIIETYGKPYFKIRSTMNDLHLKGLRGEPMDLRLFWFTVKRMYKTEKEKLHILNLIQENNSLNKALNSYVDKLTQVDECVMHYRLKGTKSGRLSSGNGSKSDKSRNHYYIDLNAQNLTKPASAYYVAEKCSMEDPESILGWKFTPVAKDYAMEHLEDLYIVEGQDPGITIRGCLKAPEGRYVVSLDYDAEELRVISSLSGDFTMFLDEKTGKISPETADPHERTAVAIWGAENYDKSKRKKAKICLGKETLLYTNNGLKHPYELVSGDTLMNEKGEPLTWAMTTEDGELIEVTYDNGVTEQYTPNHKIKVWNGSEVVWKEVKNLTSEDEVIQVTGLFKNCKNTKFVDYEYIFNGRHFKNSTCKFDICSNEFAYLGGLYLGDGHVHSKKLKDGSEKLDSVNYCVEPEALHTVTAYLSSLGINVKPSKTVGKNNKIYMVHANNIAFAKCVEDFFGRKSSKRVNKKLFGLWEEQQIKYFIAGLIDSDGSTSNGRLTFSSSSTKIIESLTLACSAIGIRVAVRNRISSYRGKKYPYKEAMLYDVPDLSGLPILVSRKRQNMGVASTNYGNWKVTKEFAVFEREKLRQLGANWKNPLYKTWQNVVNGYCRLTASIIKKSEQIDKNIPIDSKMNPLRVISKKNVSGIVYVIQTSEGLYCTPCTVSHNCNFLMSYGGGAFNLAQQLDIPQKEAEEIIEGYKKGLPELQHWKDEQIAKMYQSEGLVFSAFGRPRNFKGWINTIVKNSENYDDLLEKKALEQTSERVRMGIERRVVNHEVQSTCGDILRLVLLKLYIKYFKNRDPHIDFLSTVHDEINYTIDKEVTVDYVRDLEKLMTFDVLDPRLPISTSTDIGFTYGNMFPFVWEDDTKQVLIPKRVHHA